MGKLLDKFKEKVQQYNSIQLPEEPDKLAKPDEWLQWNIKKRSSEVTKDAIKNALMSPKLSSNTWYEVMKEALGQEEADQMRAQETTRSGYWTAADFYVREHPELLNHLTKEQKHDFEFDTNKYRRTVLTQLINEKKIPDEALEEAKLYNYTSNLIHFDIEKQLKVAGAFEKLLNPEQLKAVEDKLDSEADVLTLPDEKRMEYPYRNICNTLKANASKVIPNNPEKLKEYEDALSYASEHINMPSNAYRDELKKQEADGEKVTGEYEKSVKAKFTDGKYRDLYVEKNLNGKTEKVVENDKKDLLEDLKTNTYQMSDDTKEGMRLMLQKMHEMKLHSYSLNKNGEDGDKVYGFCKLVAKRKALRELLDQAEKEPDKVNADAIINATKEYKESWKEMQDLFALSKKYFCQDKNSFLGNVDSVRTRYMPVDFTADYVNTAHINTLFLIHEVLEKNNISIDDYLKNPASATMGDGMKWFNKNTYSGLTEGMSLRSTMNVLLRLGAYNNIDTTYYTDSPLAALQRSIIGPVYLEKNKELKEKSIYACDTMYNHLNNVLKREGDKFDILKYAPANEEQRVNRDQTLQNLIVVSENDLKPNAIIGGFPETDLHGLVINPPFDLDSYIATSDINYKNIMDRARTVMEKRDEKQSVVLSRDDVLEATLNAYNRVLTLHQADRDNPDKSEEFLDMEKEYLEGIGKLSADAKPEMLERLNEKMDAYKSKFLPTSFARDLHDLAVDADKNVYNGSGEYDKARDALKVLEDSFKEMDAIRYDYTGAEKLKKIAEIHEKIEDAKTKIDAYHFRKLGDGKDIATLDAKGQKRVKVMNRAKKGCERMTEYLNTLTESINLKNERANNAYQAAKQQGNDTPSKFGIYPDKYHFNGRPRTEQLEQMYRELKEVDPKTIISHQEFRDFRNAFEKMKEFAEKHKGDWDRETMDEYRTLAEDVKKKAGIYDDKKREDAATYEERNHRPFVFDTSTNLRRAFAVKMIDMVDEHLIHCSEKYVKEFGGTEQERALAKYTFLCRKETYYRTDAISSDREGYYKSVYRSMYYEKLRLKYITDPAYSTQAFLNDMSDESIQAGEAEMKELIRKAGLTDHMEKSTNRKNNTEWYDELENNVVSPKNYPFYIQGDENLKDGAGEEDLKDLVGVDQKYVRGEIKNLCSKLALFNKGRHLNKYRNVLKDFCYDVYKDEEGNTRLKQNIRYKGEPVLEDVDLYEKQETADYSALSDADLQNKIRELTEKRDRLNTLANAKFRELPQDMQNEITEYCKVRMDYGPYRNAENSMGIVNNIDNLEDAVKEEVYRRSETYKRMRNEVKTELDAANEVSKQRAETRAYYDGRRKTAENLKPGDILHFREGNYTRDLEVVGVENGVIFFDDFGTDHYFQEYLKPIKPEKVLNHGGVTIEEFVRNSNYSPENTILRKEGKDGPEKKEKFNGPLARELFLKNAFKEKLEEERAFMKKEEYAKRNNQLADNLFFRAFLLKEDEFIEKYREENKADYAKMEEAEIASSLKTWDGEIKAITDPVKQKEYVQTVVNNAKEKANELFENKLDRELDNRKDAYLREYVKNEIDRTYGKQLEKMKDYPTRFKNAKALYLGKNNQKEADEINDNKINDNKINDNKINENKIIEEKAKNQIDLQPSEKDPVLKAKLDQELKQISEVIRNRHKMKTEYKKMAEGENKKLLAAEIEKLDKQILTYAYKTIYRQDVISKYDAGKADEEWFKKMINAFDVPEVNSKFMKVINDSPEFKQKFEEGMKHVNSTDNLDYKIVERAAGCIAHFIVNPKDPEMPKKMNDLAGQLGIPKNMVSQQKTRVKKEQPKKTEEIKPKVK